MNVQNWLDKNTILKCIVGSHAYGTNLPESDIDIKGICIPPKDYYLGSHLFFDQYTQQKPDVEIYGLKKYIKLAADANPNILELLFIEDPIVINKFGEKLRQNRNLFVTKKAKFTFSGYAISQLKRIQTHRRWILNPPLAEPKRSEFGLPDVKIVNKEQLDAIESKIKDKLGSWDIDAEVLDEAQKIEFKEKFENILKDIGVNSDDELYKRAAIASEIDPNFIDLVVKEKRYKTKMAEWHQYKNWKATRNEKRAELEAKFGYDTKHATHLVRLMRMCKEILTEGKVLVKRPDKEELLAIRNGSWKYDDLIVWAENMDKEMSILYDQSTLPKAPDITKINNLTIELLEEFYYGKGE